jgi:tRNA G10  N-methylase Trm11
VLCPVVELIDHLLELAARSLRPKGRLVFFLPTVESQYDHARDAPRHPALREIACSKQWLHGYPPRDMFRCVTSSWGFFFFFFFFFFSPPFFFFKNPSSTRHVLTLMPTHSMHVTHDDRRLITMEKIA